MIGSFGGRRGTGGRRTRRRPRLGTTVAVAVVLAATGCGQLPDARDRVSRSFLEQTVSTGPGPAVGGGGFLHGGVARIRAKGAGDAGRDQGAAPRVVPGEVYQGERAFRVPLPPPSAATVTYPQWAAMLLRRLDAPVCGNNLVAVVTWQVQEGTRAAWNPLATTYPMPGATTFNGHGVRNYASLEQGLEATVLTLERGWNRFGYGAIVQALRRCAHPIETARAIQASWWCRNCSGGLYATALVRAVIADFNQAVIAAAGD